MAKKETAKEAAKSPNQLLVEAIDDRLSHHTVSDLDAKFLRALRACHAEPAQPDEKPE